MEQVKRVHVFTDAPSAFFFKQFPGSTDTTSGLKFTIGLEVPDNIDALIVFNRASYSIPTRLPKSRTAFIAAEPDDIHPYAARYLNQYGVVISATEKTLSTEHWKTAPCWYWFAGMSFGERTGADALRGYDYFASLSSPPEKQDKIAIVTSNKVHTQFHKSRLAFLEALMKRIPEHLDIYGRGFKTIDDKADALLPHKYHIALENCTGQDTWTEKVADPFLCWSFPFYSGCTNLGDYFPKDSFLDLDISSPDKAAQMIQAAIKNDLWSRSLPALTQARELILEKYNIAHQLVELTEYLLKQPVVTTDDPRRWIWSERALWPERGARGSVGEWAMRNAIMLFDPGAELKTVGLRKRIEEARSGKRARKLAMLEAQKRN